MKYVYKSANCVSIFSRRQLLLCILPAALAGCRPVYGPALAGTDVSYMAKPSFRGKATGATYATGRVGLGPVYNLDELNLMGQASLHRSHTFRHACLSYGGFAFAGDYNVQHLKSYQGHKLFYGSGLQAGACLNIARPNVEFRPIGVQASFSKEGGRFLKFRTEAARQDSIYDFSDSGGGLGSIMATSEVRLVSDSFAAFTLQVGYVVIGWQSVQAAVGYESGRSNFWLQGNMTYFPAQSIITTLFTISAGYSHQLGHRRLFRK